MWKKGETKRVCVTGAGGYVASWVVKFLLLKGYRVHGTVRDPCDQRKNAHLKKLENAAENLQLFKTDLLDYEGLCAAISGCDGVFHVASPVYSESMDNPERELLEPAIRGTHNVLNACLKAKVNKVVIVSSVAAVMMNPDWPKNRPMDENCWTDTEYCKAIRLWYCVAKTIAENEALRYPTTSELKITTVCPSTVIGPMLQSALNTSTLILLNFVKARNPNASNIVEDDDRGIVDVRAVAKALLLVYKNPKSEGRYICSSYVIRTQALVEMLRSMFPDYKYPKSFMEVEDSLKLCSEKLQKLGWKYRPLEETLVDAVKSLEESGLLSK